MHLRLFLLFCLLLGLAGQTVHAEVSPPPSPLRVWHVGGTVIVRWPAAQGKVQPAAATLTALDETTGTPLWSLLAPDEVAGNDISQPLFPRGSSFLTSGRLGGFNSGLSMDASAGTLQWRSEPLIAAGVSHALDGRGHLYDIPTGKDLGPYSPFSVNAGSVDDTTSTLLLMDQTGGSPTTRDLQLIDIKTKALLGKTSLPQVYPRVLLQRNSRSYLSDGRTLWVLDLAAGITLEKSPVSWNIHYDDAHDLIINDLDFILPETGLHVSVPKGYESQRFRWAHRSSREVLLRANGTVPGVSGWALWDLQTSALTPLPEIQSAVFSADHHGDTLALATNDTSDTAIELWSLARHARLWRTPVAGLRADARLWISGDRIGVVDSTGSVRMFSIATGTLDQEARITPLPDLTLAERIHPPRPQLPDLLHTWLPRLPWLFAAVLAAGLLCIRRVRRALARSSAKTSAGIDWLLDYNPPQPPTAPPPENAAQLSQGDLTLAFLQRVESQCPACGYNVFQLTQPRCPECGRALSLRLFVTEPLSRTWIFLLCITAAAAGIGLLFLFGDDDWHRLWRIPLDRRLPRIFFFLSIPLPFLVLSFRKFLNGLGRWLQPALAISYFALMLAAIYMIYRWM